ncbi:MAG: hypothetical protein IPL26_10570 [Leptospiraceae bacterium]|nr:hypothetical protein [Leptospiraceae bacterium]
MSIIIFKSQEDAIKRLKHFNKNFRIPLKDYGKEDIIKNSVTSNIFRAFHLTKIKPSQIYRNWSSENFEKIERKLKSIKNLKDYEKYLFSLSENFILYWKNQVENPNENITYGPAIKMINLLIKVMQESRNYHNQKLLPFMHIPFDIYSLLPLKEIINNLTDIDYKLVTDLTQN